MWLAIVMLAHDLIVWTQAPLLDGQLAKAEPKRLGYQPCTSPALPFPSRQGEAPPPAHPALAAELAAAFARLKALQAATG